MMHDVFVLAEEYPLAIVLSGKMSLSKGLRWSATAMGILCCTKKFATFTSAREIYTKEKNINTGIFIELHAGVWPSL